ncbi:hypothetical protein BJV77DRAFT_582259 [Russula vinacea]|nr:hypothetical protein BJV77DRAFT_582259 [Russula vinacea]
MQPNSRCPSPPPRMPSPQLLPTPLPSPPLHHQQSRPRLNASSSQPKPPSPLGQPASPGSPIRPQLHAPRAQPPPPLDLSLWLDGDDFGARRARSYPRPLRALLPKDGLTMIREGDPHPSPRHIFILAHEHALDRLPRARAGLSHHLQSHHSHPLFRCGLGETCFSAAVNESHSHGDASWTCHPNHTHPC